MNAATDIVVGFDGSHGAESALDWAAREADRRHAVLRIVTVRPNVELPVGSVGAGAVPPMPHVDVQRIGETGRARAEKTLEPSMITCVIESGSPAGALVRESRQAALVVVGHPEHGRAGEYVTGSVAFAVTGHSASDVVVVPDPAPVEPGPEHPVVVGVDGSAGAFRAATRAARIATQLGAPLVVARAWHLRADEWYGPASAMYVQPGELEDFERAVREATESTARAIRDRFPDVTVDVEVIDAHPVNALLSTAKGAGLLVVGCRGLGGFKRLILGSVSRAVVHYADLPVLVVRPDVPTEQQDRP